MAEALIWNEGSALFWTGNSTTSALAAFAQNMTQTRQITYTSYKPPHAVAFTNYAIASAATLSIGQLHAQAQLISFFEAATGGGLHAHIKNSAPGISQSGGVFLYSGTLISCELVGSDGQAFKYSFAARFPSWTAY